MGWLEENTKSLPIRCYRHYPIVKHAVLKDGGNGFHPNYKLDLPGEKGPETEATEQM